jgi:hypothetical protein
MRIQDPRIFFTRDPGWKKLGSGIKINPDAQRWVKVYLKRRVRRPQRPACKRPHPHSTCLKAKVWPNPIHGNFLESKIISFRFHESVPSITLNNNLLVEPFQIITKFADIFVIIGVNDTGDNNLDSFFIFCWDAVGLPSTLIHIMI